MNMVKNSFLALFAVLIFTSASSATPAFDYNFLEASYLYVSPDSNELDSGQGLRTMLSWSFMQGFFLEGGYEYLNFDLSDHGDVDENTFKYGVGAYMPMASGMDLVGRVGGLALSYDYNGLRGTELDGDTSGSESGVYAGGALRYKYTKGLELEPAIEYQHLNGNSTWFYEIKSLFEVANDIELSLLAGITGDSDVELSGGLRFNFS